MALLSLSRRARYRRRDAQPRAYIAIGIAATPRGARALGMTRAAAELDSTGWPEYSPSASRSAIACHLRRLFTILSRALIAMTCLKREAFLSAWREHELEAYADGRDAWRREALRCLGVCRSMQNGCRTVTHESRRASAI